MRYDAIEMQKWLIPLESMKEMKRNIETIRDRVDVLRNNTENADRNSFLVIY